MINKLSDGNIKFSSDSAVNEDSSSLSEKPFLDTGQPENVKEEKTTSSNESGCKEDGDVATKKENETDQKGKECVEKENEKDEKENEKVEKENGKEEEETQKEEIEIENENKKVESSETEECKTDDQPVRPILRIKKLSELMDSGAKRQKLDDSQGIIDSKSDVIMGETISEPVMVIEGEGSGADNQTINGNLDLNYEPSPIIGEEIEEDTYHVYGAGYGADCLTGNEGKATSSSGEDTNSSTFESATSSSNCVDGSMQSTVNDMKDNKEKLNEVPSKKLDDTVNDKTDNLDSAAKEDVKCCDDLDSNNESNELSKTEELPDGSKSPLPKKTMFFFGSPLKNASFSPSAKVEFGQVSPNSKETSDCKLNSDNNNEELVENEKDIKEVKCKKNDSEEEKETTCKEEKLKTSVETMEQNKKEDSDQSKEDNKLSKTKSEESIEINKGSDPIGLQEVQESLCIKQVAYNCGKEEVLIELTEDKNVREKDEEKKLKVTPETPTAIANENDQKSLEVTSDLKITTGLNSKMEESKALTEEKEETDVKTPDIEKNIKDNSEEVFAKNINEESKNLSVTAEESLITNPDTEESTDTKPSSKDLTKAMPASENSIKDGTFCKENTKPKSATDDCSKGKLTSDEPSTNKPEQVETTEGTFSQKDSTKIISKKGEGAKSTPVSETANKINKIPSLNITKTAKTIKDDQLHKSLRYFRTRRVANVRMSNEIRIPIKNFDPVLEAARRTTTVPVSGKSSF